jgi:acetyl esterase/lipase
MPLAMSMSTRHLVDPELSPALDQPAPSVRTLEALHARRDALPGLLPPPSCYARPDVMMQRCLISRGADDSEVALCLYRPLRGRSPLPAFLHMHGGGYIFGNAQMCGPGNVRTAAEVECLVVSVDYRLAPETKAPGALEDCYAALRWLYQNADNLGIDAARIAVGGESAGGGLAAALTLLARDRGEYPIRFQLLSAPMLDDRTVIADNVDPHVGEFVWGRRENEFAWRAFLDEEPGASSVSAYAAPGRAGDLRGLPPAYIDVGALDLFRDEDVRYALALLRGGVSTELRVIAGAYHGFERVVSAQVSLAAQRERRDALRRAFAR